MSELELKEKKEKKLRREEFEPTIEVVICSTEERSPPNNVLAETEGTEAKYEIVHEEEPTQAVRKIIIPLLIPDFKDAGELEEKVIEKEPPQVDETKANLIEAAQIPEFRFRECPAITELIPDSEVREPETPMRKIVKQILENIPDIDFEDPEECKVLEVNSIPLEKLENSSEIVMESVFVPDIVFFRKTEVIPKEFVKELIFDRTIATIEYGLTIGGDGGKVKPIDFMEEIFGSKFQHTIDRPTVILAKKPKNKKFEYIEFLKRILREVYRIRGRGLPKPVHAEALSFEDIKQEIEADKHIWVLDLDKIEIERQIRHLRDRLKELYSQNFGFLVLYGSEEKLNEVREKILRFDSPIPSYQEVEIKEDDRVFKIARLMWGLPKVNVPMPESLDSRVVRLEDEYFKKIYELASAVSTIIFVEPSSEDEENIGGESILHYATKALVVRYLKEKGVSESRIKTEYELADSRIDVYASDPKLGEVAIEVETLYGTGIPLLKLRKRIDSRLEKGLKVWIVIPNPQLIINFRDILVLRRVYRRRFGERVEFFGIDVKSKKLISISKLREN